MAEHVRRHALSLQRWAALFGASLVAGDQSVDGIPAQRPAATAPECRRRRLSWALSEPLRQDCDHFLPERSAAFLPAFAPAAEVRTCGSYADSGTMAKAPSFKSQRFERAIRFAPSVI